MPIELSWIEENRLILHRNVGDVSADDLIAVDDPLNALLDQGDVVHVLVLANPDGKGPMSLRAFTAATWTSNEHLGWTVVVGLKNPILVFVAGTASQVFKMRQRFFDTTVEALDFLNTMDPTLPKDIVVPAVS